jgi:2,5-diketo-D-gluconate reductase A
MTTKTDQVPRIPLRGDTEIPQLGFGVFQVPPEDTADVVTRALETGYRHIDTAAAYRNEAEVGQAFHASGLDRDDVFITTKCFNTDHGYAEAQDALTQSLERLGLDFVDLYLIHWPVPSQDRYVETWKAFIDMQAEGLTRSIGVSNFQPDHLRRIVDETGVTPAVNQIEVHPYCTNEEVRAFDRENGILTEAWSPIAQGQVLDDEVVRRVADAVRRTPAQVVLRWHLQRGDIIFPKSVTPARMEENFALFDFELDDDAMQDLSHLNRGDVGRTGPHPDTFDYVPD